MLRAELALSALRYLFHYFAIEYPLMRLSSRMMYCRMLTTTAAVAALRRYRYICFCAMKENVKSLKTVDPSQDLKRQHSECESDAVPLCQVSRPSLS